MYNILLCISYDGTYFHGYQSQKKERNVQDCIGEALYKIFHIALDTNSAGRTDAGVHAERQYLNFKVSQSHIPIEKLSYALNSILPQDIRVLWSMQVHEAFHARYSALRRTYYYQVCEGRVLSPYMRLYNYGIPIGLDWTIILEELEQLVGTHDFRVFAKTEDHVQNYERTIFSIYIKELYNMKRIYIEANGFLWKMVRSIIGTVLERAVDRMRGKEIRHTITDILHSRNRALAGTTAPAWALYLSEVYYKELDGITQYVV